MRLVDRGLILAGSALAPLDAFRNAIGLFGQDIAAASRLCSGTQARLMGLNAGEIAVGRDADLLILDEELALQATLVAGQVLYTAAGVGNEGKN